MRKKITGYLKKLLPFIGIIIFIYIIYQLDFEEIKISFLSIQPIFIFISLLLTFPRILIRNYSWQLILKGQNIQISYPTSLKILLIGYFYGTITPGYFGKLAQVIYLKDKTNNPYGKLFVNTMIESIIHTLPIYAMLIVGAFIILDYIPMLFNIIIGYLLILAIILFYFIKKERGERLFFALIKFLIPKKSRLGLERFVQTFYDDFPKLRILIIPFFLGVIIRIIIFSQYYIFIIALGLDIPYLYFLFLFPAANAASLIPITFAGLGVRELSAIIIFSTLFGVSESEIFVISLIGFIVTDIITGLYGFILSLTETGLEKSIKFS